MISKILQFDNITQSLRKHKSKKYSSRSLDGIESIMIHHSATKNGKATSYARYHVNNLNWPGIGYHFVIDSEGIHQTNELATLSYHCSGMNRKTIGVCHTGHFDKQDPTDTVYLNYIKAILIIDDIMNKQLPIIYHFDYSSKTCPGSLFDRQKFEKELKDFRVLTQK